MTVYHDTIYINFKTVQKKKNAMFINTHYDRKVKEKTTLIGHNSN